MDRPPEIATPLEPARPKVSGANTRPSLIWLVPVIAALVGLSLLVHAWLSAGPRITITFQHAAGLEAGKTLVKYKDVVVGTVSGVALSTDRKRVNVIVELNADGADFARHDSRFWVVRPRIGAGGISGVDTVFSGAYIAVDAGRSTESRREFDGLETPPTVISDTPGRVFQLRADDLGSLDIGSPVYYRRIQVGQVASFQLDPNGNGVTVQVFIQAPNDKLVTRSARFWNASGVDVSLGADGLKLNTQSVATVLAGGIAFASPDDYAPPAAERTQFTLAKDEETAMAPPDGPPLYLRMRFDQSLRGLAVNAPVEFFGANIGRVTSLRVAYDAGKRRFEAVVDAVVYPQRLGSDAIGVPAPRGGVDDKRRSAMFIRDLVAQGLRAQARPGNLLTGQLYLSFDFIPSAAPAQFDVNAQPLPMPTVRGDFERLQEQLVSILGKVDKIPLDSIGRHLDDNLAELNKTLKQVNGEVLPEAKGAFESAKNTFGAAQSVLAEDGPMLQRMTQTFGELQRSARSFRTLTDMLGRHPEALLRGRPAEVSVAPAEPSANPSTHASSEAAK